MALPIEDYALIGDRRTAPWSGATARSTGCACRASTPPPASPRCSAPTTTATGSCARSTSTTSTRRYVDASAVLETTFTTADRRRHAHRRDAARRRPGRRGPPGHRGARHGADAPRVDGPPRLRRDPPWVRRQTIHGEEVITAIGGPDRLVLRGPRLPVATDHRHVDEFDVAAGDVLTFSTTWLPSYAPLDGTRPTRRPDPGDHRARRGVGGPVPRRPAARRRRTPLAAHAAAAHRTRRPAASSPRPPPRCPRTPAASATGTTATAGCATPRSRSAR